MCKSRYYFSILQEKPIKIYRISIYLTFDSIQVYKILVIYLSVWQKMRIFAAIFVHRKY